MPDFMHIRAIEPELPIDDAPRAGDEDLVWDDIREAVDRVMNSAPHVDFTLVYAGTRDWVDVNAWLVRGGTAEDEPLQLSRSRDDCDGCQATPAPEAPLLFQGRVDDIIDLIDLATGEYEAVKAPKGEEITLPFFYEDEGLLLEAAAGLAKHLVLPRATRLVQVQGRYYELVFVRGVRAELVPLWPWMTDGAARNLVQRTLKEPGAAMSRACPRDGRKRNKSSHEKSPLITGAMRARVAAATAFEAEKPGAFDQLSAAWVASENQGERAASLRHVLVRRLADSDPLRAVSVFRSTLPSESNPVRESIYEALTGVDSEAARQALVEGYRDERGAVRELIGTILWRSEETIKTLVLEGLIPAWTADAKHAKRILRLMDEECMRVHRAWLVGAPLDLVEALGSRLDG